MADQETVDIRISYEELVRCPHCKAEVGQPCKTPKGKRYPGFHSHRTKRGRAWRDIFVNKLPGRLRDSENMG